uniref:C3H1-type domain-containing protein n=1 Tax=Globodera rostochiensis TaxID=31243 RepID=A0A914IBK6_GLORO
MQAKGVMDATESTTARAKLQRRRLRLPRELIYELILRVPCTECDVRRLLITCSFIYQCEALKEADEAKFSKIMRRCFHSIIWSASITSCHYCRAQFSTVVSTTDQAHRQFYAIAALDPTLVNGPTAYFRRRCLRVAINNGFLGSFDTFYFLKNEAFRYDVVRFNFHFLTSNADLARNIHRVMMNLDEALCKAAAGEFDNLMQQVRGTNSEGANADELKPLENDQNRKEKLHLEVAKLRDELAQLTDVTKNNEQEQQLVVLKALELRLFNMYTFVKRVTFNKQFMENSSGWHQIIQQRSKIESMKRICKLSWHTSIAAMNPNNSRQCDQRLAQFQGYSQQQDDYFQSRPLANPQQQQQSWLPQQQFYMPYDQYPSIQQQQQYDPRMVVHMDDVHQQQQNYFVGSMQDDDGMVIGETCTVISSSPTFGLSPDMHLQQPFGGGQSAAAHIQSSSATAAAYDSYFEQAQYLGPSPTHHWSPHSSSMGLGSGQLYSQTQISPSHDFVRRTPTKTPFEEEEEEEEDEEVERANAQGSTSAAVDGAKRMMYSSKMPTKIMPDSKQQPLSRAVVEADKPKVRRRKQEFEKSAKVMMSSTASDPSPKRVIFETVGGMKVEVKYDEGFKKPAGKVKQLAAEEAPKNLVDKSLIVAQTTQRLGTVEGWRRMNGWLKSAIKQSDGIKLKQLLAQLLNANISVDLLRDEVDTPKLVKKLQKSDDKGIATMAMNLVNDWKQKVRSEKRAVKSVDSLPKLEPDKKAVLPAFHQTPSSSSAGSKGKQTAVKSDKTTTTPTTLAGSSNFESPLTRILSATDKFHAQNRAVQPKRKSVEVMFSDNFMDSLCGPSGEASATAPTKKPKIIRKKLSDLCGPSEEASSATGPTKKPKIIRKKLSEAVKRDSLEEKDGQQQLGGGQPAVGAFGNKKRVRFSDEFGIELAQTRFFEIEEGERVNVTKMHLSREEIKHFDSHREKITLHQHHSFGAFSLTDPMLMPPGHRLQQPQISPQQQHWGGAATSGYGQMAKFGKEETLYRWKMSPLDETFCLVVPGSKSQAKNIEATRIRGVMEAICLPEINLPISDMDENEYKQHQIETIDHVPKIIPLEMISEGVAAPASQAGLVTPRGENGADAGRLLEERGEEDKKGPDAEIKPKSGGDETVAAIAGRATTTPKLCAEPPEGDGLREYNERMEEDEEELEAPYSPEAPDFERLEDYEEEEDDEVTIIEHGVQRKAAAAFGGSVQKKAGVAETLGDSPEVAQCNASPVEHGPASPEPEPMDESTESVELKEIPTEAMDTDDEQEEAGKEDLDIREQFTSPTEDSTATAAAAEQQPAASSSPSATAEHQQQQKTAGAVAAGHHDLSKVQEFLRNGGVTASLLKRLSSMVGSHAGSGASSSTHRSQDQLSVVGEGTPKGMEVCSAPVTPYKTDQFVSSPIVPSGSPCPAVVSLAFNNTTSGNNNNNRFLLPQFAQSHIRALNSNTTTTNTGFPPPTFPQQHAIVGPTGGRVPFPDFSRPPPNFTSPPPQIRPPQFRIQTPVQQQHSSGESPTKSGAQTSDESSSAIASSTTNEEGKTTSPGPPGLDAGGSPPPPQTTTEQHAQQPPPQQQQQQHKELQPLLNEVEARALVGPCQFFMRHNTCKFGERCKFAHGEDSVTFGVQMAMRGVKIGVRGGARGRGGFIGRGGGFRSAGADDRRSSDEPGDSGRDFDDKRPRRRGTSGRYISPVRSSGDSRYDRRYRSSPDRHRRRRRSRTRSRSRDRYSRRSRDRRRKSRSRDRSHSRERSRSSRDRSRSSRDRARARSSSSSSSSSTRTYSSRSASPPANSS